VQRPSAAYSGPAHTGRPAPKTLPSKRKTKLMAQKDSIIKEYIEVTPRRIKRQWSLPMSELGDYRRLIEAPMIAKYEATIKDWQDSSEAYRRDAEVAQARLADAEIILREFANQDYSGATRYFFRKEAGRSK
jgi:hypothetical protein